MIQSDWLQVFKKKKIVVLGDVMLDEYLIGHVNRISPEAPVPIVSLEKEDLRLGGAANVALNLKSLGIETYICSIIGDDKDGESLLQLCKNQGIYSSGLQLVKNRKTTKKTRVLGNNQQLLRIDSEQINPINAEEEQFILKYLKELFNNEIDALIFEDYDKGCLTPFLIKEVIQLCKKYNVITTVDPKKNHFFNFQGVDLFKPNLKELKEGLNMDFNVIDNKEFNHAVEELRLKLEHKITLITLSEQGIYINNGVKHFIVPAHLRNIADVSGAGDTVISVATLCLLAGLSMENIAEVANLAGGLVCEKSGVVSIVLEELINELEEKNISISY
ncbi:MAG: D-glycero-beta-D-manno-heptose-7-phosphate kinase [Flavobacteriia bacterium]|nr:D-glycero-beta-D-manno-heptose-7-phosphate kinase [Flavobacteriia bacterium]